MSSADFNIDSLLDDINDADFMTPRGGVDCSSAKYVPHPPKSEKSPVHVSSTNPKSKFTVFPTSFSPSYDRSTDALRSGSNSSSTYSDESYSRNSSKPPRESFNMSPEHKSGSSGRSDNRQFGGNEFQRESVPKDNGRVFGASCSLSKNCAEVPMEAKNTLSHINDYRANPVTKQKSAICDDFDEDEDDGKMSRGWRDKDENGKSDFASNTGSFKRVPTVQRLEDMVIESIGESHNGSNSSSSSLHRPEHDSRTNPKKEESSRIFPPNSNNSADQTSSRSLVASSQHHTLFKSSGSGRTDSSSDSAVHDPSGRYKDKHTGDQYQRQQNQQQQFSRGRDEKDRVPDIFRTTSTTSSRPLSNTNNNNNGDNINNGYRSSSSCNNNSYNNSNCNGRNNSNYNSCNYSSNNSTKSNGQCTDSNSSRFPHTTHINTHTNTNTSTVSPSAPSSKTSSAVGAAPLGSRARCTRIILSGSSCARGLRSSVFIKCACDNLRCLSCNFKVHIFLGSAWMSGPSVDYMFFRNNTPNESKLSQQLERSPSHCAYCCQCSWTHTAEERTLSQGVSGDPQWICAGH